MTTIVPNETSVREEIARLEAQLSVLRAQRDSQSRACAGIELEPGKLKTPDSTSKRRQEHLRRGIIPYLRDYNWAVTLTAPVIYATFIALVILDVALTIYQWICFPAYGIEKVRRSEYVVIDRHQLAYLNVLEKLNCAFFGYANGLLAYGMEISSRTEQFWCPIKHAAQARGTHHRMQSFVDYEDGAPYRILQRNNAAVSRGCSGGHCKGCEE